MTTIPGRRPRDAAGRSRFFTRLPFSDKIIPQTAIFVGTTVSRAALMDTGFVETERTYCFKIGYAWVL